MKRLVAILTLLLAPVAAVAQSPGVGLDSLPAASTLTGSELLFGYQAGTGGSGATICARGWCPRSITPAQIATYLESVDVGLVFVTGTPTAGHCAEWSAANTIEDSGAACGGGGGSTTFQVNGTGTSSSNPINFINSAATDGLTLSFSNPTGGSIQLGFSGVLTPAGGGIGASSFIAAGLGTFSGSITSGHCAQWSTSTGNLVDSGAGCGSGGSNAFSALTSSTNTTAAMLVGTGASLGYTGSGTVAATTLLGSTWAIPSPIGSTTPAAGSFTTLSATGNLTTNITGTTQCVEANSSGVLSGVGSACGAGGSGTVNSGTSGDVAYYASTGTAVSGATVGAGLALNSGTLAASYSLRVVSGTSDTILSTDCANGVAYTSSSAIAVTLPQATGSFSTCNVDIISEGTGTATVTPTTSTINGGATITVAGSKSANLTASSGNYLATGTYLVSSGSTAFSSLTGGTNTSAAMVVGSGASLSATGSGTISATNTVDVNGAAVPASATVVGTNSSSQIVADTTVTYLVDTGTTFTLSGGSGACATTSTLTGGSASGRFTCTGTTGTSAITIVLPTAVNGWDCKADDRTTSANVLTPGTDTTTGFTFSGTVNANDVIRFMCIGS
jgi:hypothetical protein